MEIEGGDNRMPRYWRRQDLLRSFAAILIEGDLVLTMFAGQDLIKRLFEAFSSFSFGPEHFVVIDHPVRIPPSFPAVPNDLSGSFSIGIDSDVKGTQGNSRRQAILYTLVFRSA